MPTRWNGSHRVEKRAAAKIANKKHYASTLAAPSADARCMARVQSALGDMMSAVSTKNGNRRHTAAPRPSGFMDLSGYALHQRLRTAPGAEMYVTGMRAKVLPPRDAAAAGSSVGHGGDNGAGAAGDHRSWARVDGCQYDPLGNTLEARMRFGRTLMVSGSVRLLYGGGGGAPPAETGCDMTLRLRPRAGLGFTAVPLTMPEKLPPNRLLAAAAAPTMTIRTTATFIDPEPAADDPTATYVSVHSYNCVGGAAGFAGNREQSSAASTDRFEHISSAEDGSDELQSADFDVDADADDESIEFGDWRNGRRPTLSPSKSGVASAKPAAAPVVNAYVSAGFVGPAAITTTTATTGPEPRLRRIQYHGKPSQHPVLTVTNVVDHNQAQDQLLMEMEEVFVRGVRSLLAKHMERALQPVLKDSLMANMGYTVSYG